MRYRLAGLFITISIAAVALLPLSALEAEVPLPKASVQNNSGNPDQTGGTTATRDVSRTGVSMPVRPYRTPRDLLHLLGLSNSLLDTLDRESGVGPPNREVLVRILDCMPAISWDDIVRWQHERMRWQQLDKEPRTGILQFYPIRGRVRKVEHHGLDPRIAKLFSWSDYYEVLFEFASAPYKAVVYTRTVPKAWTRRAEWNERGGAVGLFLSRTTSSSNDNASGTTFVFVARRVAWYPDRIEKDLRISAGQVVLGDLGFDYGLFDVVRMRNRQPIGTVERECFYGLLSAANKKPPSDLERLAQKVDLAAMLQHPDTLAGNLYQVPCSIFRITKIIVGDRSIQTRFGIHEYYQIDAFVSLGDQVVTIESGKNKKPGPVYSGSFPFTFCTARLPAAWRGWIGQPKLNQPALITGCFYKLWVYPNAYVAKFDSRERQLSPMLIALQCSVLQSNAAGSSSTWGLVAGILFIIGLGAVWLVLLRTQRADARRAAEIRKLRKAQIDIPEDEANAQDNRSDSTS